MVGQKNEKYQYNQVFIIPLPPPPNFSVIYRNVSPFKCFIKYGLILFLICFIVEEVGFAQSKSSHRQKSQSQVQEVMPLARYKRLSARQKTRLYNVMLRTMVAMELSRSRRQTSALLWLWQLGFPMPRPNNLLKYVFMEVI